MKRKTTILAPWDKKPEDEKTFFDRQNKQAKRVQAVTNSKRGKQDETKLWHYLNEGAPDDKFYGFHKTNASGAGASKADLSGMTYLGKVLIENKLKGGGAVGFKATVLFKELEKLVSYYEAMGCRYCVYTFRFFGESLNERFAVTPIQQYAEMFPLTFKMGQVPFYDFSKPRKGKKGGLVRPPQSLVVTKTVDSMARSWIPIRDILKKHNSFVFDCYAGMFVVSDMAPIRNLFWMERE